MMALQPFVSEDELTALLQAFESTTLTHEEWNHRAHLAVASCYVFANRHGAVDVMRAGIKKLNQKHGVVDSPTRGYHESITRFWIAMISDLTRTETSRLRIVNAALDRFADKQFLLEYYSRDLIMSTEARAEWVEPDLKALPSF